MKNLLLLSVMFLLPPAAAAEDKAATGPARAVAPYLDDRTVAVLHLDLAALDVKAVEKSLAGLFKQTSAGRPEGLQELAGAAERLKEAGARALYVVFSLAELPEQPPLLLVALPEETNAAALFGGLADPRMKFVRAGGLVVGACEVTHQRLKEHRPADRPEVAKAFAAAGPGLAQLVLLPTRDTRRVLEEVMPKLPPEVGGDSIQVLTRGLHWIVLYLEPPPKLTLHLLAQAEDKAAAGALKGLLERCYALAGKQQEVRQGVPNFDRLSKALTPEAEGNQLRLQVEMPALVELLEPPAEKVREAQQRIQTINDLKQLGLAMHNYHDSKGHFPARASQDTQGKPLLSWRVQLLPLIEQDALYKEFKLDEPWDSEHNKKLIAKMPKLYASPTNPKAAMAGKTTILAPTGAKTMFPDLKGLKIQDVVDGTANTIFLLDVDDDKAAIWTKPDDLEVDFKDPLKGLGGKFANGFLALFVDGSVRMISSKVDADLFRAMLTPAGGEPIHPPK
jgi:hypothetical protein